MKSRRGFTLLEMIVSIAIGSGILLVGIKSFPMFQKFMLYGRLRQQANTEARSTIDMLRHTASHGKFSTLVILNPPNCLPSSTIQFGTTDGTAYQIGWSSAPYGTVTWRETPPGGQTQTRTIATNVAVFLFAQDLNDPAAIDFKYSSQTALDNSGKPESVYQVDLPIETIRLEGGL